MLLVIAIVFGAIPVGVAVARWWVVPLPAIAAAMWVTIAALRGGDATVDDTSVWTYPLFYGGFASILCAAGRALAWSGAGGYERRVGTGRAAHALRNQRKSANLMSNVRCRRSPNATRCSCSRSHAADASATVI